MSKARVPLFGQPRNFVVVTPEATVGATIGTNLYNADGTLFDPSTLTGTSTTIVNGVGYAHDKRSTNAITINASDDKTIIELTFAGAITITVSGLIPFSKGFDFIVFCSGSGGQATFVGTNGMVISSSDSLKTRTLFSPVGFMVDDTNEATLYGDIEPVAPSLSVLARALNSIGAPSFLVAAANGQVLRRFGDVLAFSNVLASEVTNTPTGNIAATNVQAAINELDTEKAPVVHTHTASQITDFNSASRAQTEAELVAGANVTITPSGSGATRQLTISTSGGGVTNGDKGDITVSGSAYVAGDPFYSNVYSLLNFQGTTGSTVFTDEKGLSWTAGGNAQLDNGLTLDGAGDWIETPDTAEWSQGTGDFTFEMVVNLVSNVSQNFFNHYITTSGYTGGIFFGTNASGQLVAARAGVAITVPAAGSAVPTGVDTHVAISRTSGVTKTFINGVQQNSVTDTNSYNASLNPPAIIGLTRTTGTEPMNGKMKSFRYTRNIGRYTTVFTPPSSPFPTSLPSAIDGDPDFASVSALLHFDGADASTTFTDVTGKVWTASGNAQIDNAQSKFGGASCLFDGAGDSVSSTDTNIITMSEDFTVEYWVRQATAGTTTMTHVHLYDSGGTNNGLHIWRRVSDGALMADNGLVGTTAGSIIIALNTWTHIAVVRDAGTIRAYVNGIQALSHAVQGYPATINLSSIGMFKGSLYAFNGHIDDFRITKGVCRYQSGTTFSPPAQAYYDALPVGVAGDTEFASVASLLHFDGTDGAAVFTDVTGKVWTANGNAQIDTALSKFGGASGLFDGTGDYLTTPISTDFAFGTGDFTVEMWLYVNPSTAAWSRAIEFQAFDSDGGGHISFNGTDGAGARRLGWQQGRATGGGDRLESNSAFPTNAWTHYAVSRQGNTTRAFVNGVLQSATITASGRAQDNFTNTSCVIASTIAFTNFYMGSIDDLRITKGVARYTSTFTPPVIPHYDSLPSGAEPLWTIDNDAVTFAKMQNINTNKLLGRSTAGVGDVEEITLGTNLNMVGGTLNSVVDDLNKSANLSFWTGTQAQYDALGAWGASTLYFIEP